MSPSRNSPSAKELADGLLERSDRSDLDPGAVRAAAEHVFFVARKYGDATEDAVQAGCIGILKAMERFDPTRGASFGTYARKYVRAEINAALRETLPVRYLLRDEPVLAEFPAPGVEPLHCSANSSEVRVDRSALFVEHDLR